MAPTEFQIIFVNYNSTDSLLTCLASIEDMGTHITPRIWVWDNHSNDNPGRIRRQFPNVQLIENIRNIGFGAAVNKGLACADAPYFMLLNPDTVLSKGFIDKVLEYMSANPDIGILGPKITDFDGSLQESARAFPNGLTGLFGRKSPLSFLFPNNTLTKKNLLAGSHNGKKILEPDWVSGACMVVRREAMEQVGLIDERFFMYWEDTDWCRRMKEKGWRVVYYPEVAISHFGGLSSRSQPIRSSLEFSISAYRLYTKYAKGCGKVFSPLVFGLLAIRFYLFACINILSMKPHLNRIKTSGSAKISRDLVQVGQSRPIL
jgi:GT2 family glycosyltransferase